VRAILTAVALLVGAAAAGCQSELTITVEKLVGVSGRVEDDGSADATLSAIHNVLVTLEGVCLECQTALGVAAFDLHASPLGRAQSAATALRPAAESLLLRRARGETSGMAFASQVEALRQAVVPRIPDLSADFFGQLIETQVDPARRAEVAAAVSGWSARLRGVASQAQSLSVARVGFGGFRQAGVYSINPGDAAYDAVLAARAAGSPLTQVRVQATGDSNVMIVQESPGQMRLYQLANDPVSIMRNAGFVMDKVMQAAVKFGGA
jgi:hypothetical protein